jgi:putative Mn2+ efflux pump MntP
MSLVSLIIIAIGLSMDAFAVSITSGIAIKRMHLGHAIVIGLFFGSFQALMPLLGWVGGIRFALWIKEFDHWIACAILAFLGLKMILESRSLEQKQQLSNPMEIPILFMMAVATSIDALAVGVTLSFLEISILTPITIIGSITFLLSFFGTYIGNSFGSFLESKIEIAGGVMLIGIGFKILIEHLFFS